MKLSPAQRKVIDLMKEGWAMGARSSIRDSRTWLQKNGVGRGGEVEPVKAGTFQALLDRGLIAMGKYSFPIIEYHLTEKGRTA